MHGWKVAVFALAAYAVVMTALAVYGLVFKAAELPPDHPLSIIPDDFGEFPATSRKRVTAARVPLDGALPDDQIARMGGKIEIGQLIIEPVKIEKRKLILVRESDEERVTVPKSDGFVLQLRVTNSSKDLTIFPLDPAFDRSATGIDAPATRLMVGSESFAGGPIPWPFGKRITREYEQSQEAENKPLAPGETRDYFVCSADDPRLMITVKHTRLPLLWRVQVRRGLIEYRGKDIPVTAIIGVEFEPSDVAGL
jgi:hypothetical protein